MTPGSAPRSGLRLAQRIAAALLALGLGSCTAALGLDGYASASEQICALLGACNAKWSSSTCTKHVDTGLDGADAGSRGTWIAAFSDQGCLESCTSARACLGKPPVCGAAGGACTIAEDCCGSLVGTFDCNDHRCCTPLGHPCGDDGDCCANAGKCDTHSGTCGGVVCRTRGTACDVDQQCCTKRCTSKGVCAATICNDPGFDCTADDDCCRPFVCDGTTHHCENNGCEHLGAHCAADADCCSGSTCFEGVCSAGACHANDVDCLDGAACCSMYCDPMFFVCANPPCTTAGQPCASAEGCCSGTCANGVCGAACSDAYCSVDADCCSQQCLAGTCKPVPVLPTCNHTVCEAGLPLDQNCTSSGPCVAAVCLVDAFCCQTGWDARCVMEVQEQAACANVCP